MVNKLLIKIYNYLELLDYFESKNPSVFWLSTAIIGWFFSFFIVTNSYTPIESSSINPQIISLRGGDRKSLRKRDIGREILYNRLFPDWPDRVEYQKEREKYYKSGLAKINQQKKYVYNSDYRRSLKLLTDQEIDALDYYSGKGFYKQHQNEEALPNIYDSRKSLLLKMKKNAKVRTEFITTLNERYNNNE